MPEPHPVFWRAFSKAFLKGNNMDNQDNKSFAFASQEEFTEAVNKIVHGAVTSRLTSFEGKIDKLIAAKAEPAAPPMEEPSKDRPTVSKALDEVKKLREELAKKDAQLSEKTLKSAAAAALTKLGLPGSTHRAALALLNEDKLISLDEEGNAKFSQNGELTDLETGIKGLLKTSDEFKSLVPNKAVVGAGDRKYQMNSSSPKTEQYTSDDLLEAMTEFRNS
jgi:hypothetical protein